MNYQSPNFAKALGGLEGAALCALSMLQGKGITKVEDAIRVLRNGIQHAEEMAPKGGQV